jgi:hypothetical protein
MIEIDSALYRMKAYSGLLLASTTHEQKDIGQDISSLIRWIEYARPLLGAITTDAQALNPYAQMQQRGYQAQTLPPEPKPEPENDDTAEEPAESPPPVEKPAEDKPVA